MIRDQALWVRLARGDKVTMPLAWQPAGYRRIRLAERVGQLEDWVLALPDGSRLHAWLMRDGAWIVHRDAIDPDRSPLHALAHIATETRVGKVLCLGLAVMLVGSALF
jgi:hypothetical protein